MQELSIETERAAEHDSRIRSCRSRKLLDLLGEHAWLLARGGWLCVDSRSGEILHLAEQRHLVRRENLWATDPSEAMIQAARSKFPGLADWIIAASVDIPLDTSSADVILANLGNAEDLPAVLQELVRIAKPNGVIALALPAQGGFDLLQIAAQDTWNNNPAWHGDEQKKKIYWDLHEIIKLAHRSGAIPFYGATLYEPIGYSSAHLFLEDLTREGHEEWMSRFKEKWQEAAWREICDEWLDELPPGNGGYRHEGQSSYLLLRAVS